MAIAQKTWFGDQYWKLGGGVTVWDSMAYDPALDLLYIGTGNGSTWNRKVRIDGKGDNLFLSSIVALKPETGDYVWHYQTTPGESWDFTATQSLILADLNIDGKARKVIMQRSEEHTSELQSLMRSSYAVFCLKKTNQRDTLYAIRTDTARNKNSYE